MRISDEEFYEQFLGAINHCSSWVKSRSDEELLCCLFEEFVVEVDTFTYGEGLERLRIAGYIDDETVADCGEVRRRYHALECSPLSEAEIRTDPEWNELFQLCDRIKARLDKNSEQS